MLPPETHTKVLIVGAGPSGLMMAAQLLRYGIQPVIIDNKQGPTDHSNALVVQARSLEIYRQLGIVDGVIKNGNPVKGASFNIGGEEKAKFQLTEIGEGQTPYPYLFLYQQSKNERALLQYLTMNTCPVYWNTSLTSLKQTANQVEVQIQSGDKPATLTCDWVIGADGAHSSVRKQLKIPFNGDTYGHEFYLADIELSNKELNESYVQLYLSKNGFAGFFPMPEKKRFRVIGILPPGLDKDAGIQLEDILPQLDDITSLRLNVTQNNWFTIYRLHHRMANQFRERGCFLIGDAAHIHSPVGGQGMNTGLQDAYNLAWKLAGVVNGQMKESILNSYSAERMPVAKTLLNTTDRIFSIIMSEHWYTRLFKLRVMPHVLKFAWGKKSLRESFFKIVSQIGISYRDSNINLHISQSTQVKAGDRLPYLKVYDEKREEETDLHEWCSKPGFTLIIFGKFDEMFLFNIARWITNKYPNTLNFFYLPPSGKNVDVFNAIDAKPHMQKAIIVRPDMYIGLMSDTVDMVLMDNYLKNIVGITDLR